MSIAPAYSHDDAAEIGRAVLSLRRITGLPVAFGGAVEAGGPAASASRPSQVRLTELAGTSTTALRGLGVAAGSGLGGKVLALGRPVAVTDYPSSRTISHEYDGPVATEGLRSIVAVPVVVRQRVRAVLYAALRQPVSFGERVFGAAMAVARDLEQEFAVRDEVERRLAGLAVARAQADAGAGSSAAWEQVRQAHAELRTLAHQVDDAQVRRQLLAVCARLATPPATGPAGTPVAHLSPRELDVLACVSLGHTNAEVAGQLGLLPETVKSYLRAAMRKLDAHSRLEAVVAARRAGLLP